MASSGSDNFSVNRNEIINLAAEMAGVKGTGTVLSAATINSMAMLLNLIVKQWMGKADFAPGLKVWSRKRAYLFPALNTSSYSLGPSGTHFTATYYSTTLDANEAIGQTTLSVTSTASMVNADNIGIRCNDGSIHWSTVSSFVANDTVTIASALTVAADSGATVYYYTSKAPMPLDIISIRRRDTSNNETPMAKMTLADYEEGILNKQEDGDPSSFLYERGITNGTIRFDLEPTDTSEVYMVTYLRPIEDFDSATDSPDYPQEWYRALVGQLAMDVSVWRGVPLSPEVKLYRDESLGVAQNVDAENEVVFFQPEL